jgi:hypothetical protein
MGAVVPTCQVCPAAGCEDPGVRDLLSAFVGSEAIPLEDSASIGTQLAELGKDVHSPDVGGDVGLVDVQARDLCTLTDTDTMVGDHVCPIENLAAAEEFVAGSIFDEILDQCKDQLMAAFQLTEDEIKEAKNLVCAVSKPAEGGECPLVFTSAGFEKLTGYPSEFSSGRSCRFLQPTFQALNDAINLQDRKLMREFCTNPETHPPGTTIVNLLLNERYDGPRFWNLLKMVYVEVQPKERGLCQSGERYIFALQTTLDAYMPKALTVRTDDVKKNQQITDAISTFADRLNDLRNALGERSDESLFELATFASDFLNSLSVKKGIVQRKKSTMVQSFPAIAAASEQVEIRKSVALKMQKHEGLALKLKAVEDLTTPVPNKCVVFRAGQAVQVSAKTNPALFSALSSDQMQAVESIVVSVEFLTTSENVPCLKVTVDSPKTSGEKLTENVYIRNKMVPKGAVREVKIGDTVAFGSQLTFRVTSLPSNKKA